MPLINDPVKSLELGEKTEEEEEKRRSDSAPAAQRSCQLVVSNVAASTTEDELADLFADFGIGVSVSLDRQAGVARVGYEDQGDAETAKYCFDGVVVNGKSILIDIVNKKEAADDTSVSRPYETLPRTLDNIVKDYRPRRWPKTKTENAADVKDQLDREMDEYNSRRPENAKK